MCVNSLSIFVAYVHNGNLLFKAGNINVLFNDNDNNKYIIIIMVNKLIN